LISASNYIVAAATRRPTAIIFKYTVVFLGVLQVRLQLKENGLAGYGLEMKGKEMGMEENGR